MLVVQRQAQQGRQRIWQCNAALPLDKRGAAAAQQRSQRAEGNRALTGHSAAGKVRQLRQRVACTVRLVAVVVQAGGEGHVGVGGHHVAVQVVALGRRTGPRRAIRVMHG